jgi:hypothetical protein
MGLKKHTLTQQQVYVPYYVVLWRPIGSPTKYDSIHGMKDVIHQPRRKRCSHVMSVSAAASNRTVQSLAYTVVDCMYTHSMANVRQ